MNIIKRFILYTELKYSNGFIIVFTGVRILGVRFLNEEEEKQVHIWIDKGKIIENGIHRVVSPHGNVYEDRLFKIK